MKVILVTASLLVLFAFDVGVAQDIGISRVGVHGGLSAGGDVEDSDLAFGAQAEMAITDNFFVELAVSLFSDEYQDQGVKLEQDLTTIGLSAIYRGPLTPTLQGYALAGLNYNIVDMDADVDAAMARGMPVRADLDIDDSFGFHVGVGLNYAFHAHVEAFAEFRFTFLELDGDVKVEVMDVRQKESFKGDYNYGLLKLGVNYLF